MPDDPAGAPAFESRILILEDGTVIIEHAGEGLQEIARHLAGAPELPPAKARVESSDRFPGEAQGAASPREDFT